MGDRSLAGKLHKAINNNIGLYASIFGSRALTFQQTDDVWYSFDQAPPLYSNLISISRSWEPDDDDIMQNLIRGFQNDHWSKLSVKDSFNVLDLTPFGFAKLFDASWVYRETHMELPPSSSSGIEYKPVKDENTFEAWEVAWSAKEEDEFGKQIFDISLLADPNLTFLAGFESGQIVSGCLLNRTDDVLGLSNVFAPNDDPTNTIEMIAAINKYLGTVDIVGYQQNVDLDNGFESVGELSVWLLPGC